MTQALTKIPVTIVYTPGTYGSYFHWALRTVAGFETVDNPLSYEGNSHLHRNTWVPNPVFRQSVVNNETNAQELWNCIYNEFDRNLVTVTMHPSLYDSSGASFNDMLHQVAEDSTHVILLDPDLESLPLYLNNVATKIHPGGEDAWVEIYLSNAETKHLLTSQWSLDPSIATNDIPRWALREFLSLQLYPSWLNHTGKNNARKHFSNVIQVPVIDVLNNLENALRLVTRRTNLEYYNELYELKVLPVHLQMLNAQRFRSEPALLNDIVSHTLHNIPIEWGSLSLISESLVQHYLREQGYEIKCFELDTFPTSSVQLKELIYKDPA